MSTELKKQDNLTPAQAETAYRRPYYTVDGTKEAYTVSVFMPGVAKDDYTVTLEHDELLVEGRKVLPLPAGARLLHREITPESYKLRLQLNIDVDAEKISARSEDGLLTVTLPVATEALPRTIEIQ